MNMEEVIENELKCVQRNCCRLENECAKCDLVLPIEEIINAYNEALRIKKENIKLKEELKKWKDEWQEQVQKANDEGYARTLQTIQLNKAKKIIGNLYAICKDNHYPNTSVLMEQAEQFLKE